MESSGVDPHALLARLRQLALDTSAVASQLALRAGGQLVAGSGLVTVTRASQLAGLSDQTVRRAVERGDLHGERVESTGGVHLVVIARADLFRWAGDRASGHRRKTRRGTAS